MALEILHDVEEVVVYVRPVLELDLDELEIRQGILHIERSTCGSQ